MPATKRQENAERALDDVLTLFDSGALPEKIAQTVIARAAGHTVALTGYAHS